MSDTLPMSVFGVRRRGSSSHRPLAQREQQQQRQEEGSGDKPLGRSSSSWGGSLLKSNKGPTLDQSEAGHVAPTRHADTSADVDVDVATRQHAAQRGLAARLAEVAAAVGDHPGLTSAHSP